MAWQQQATAKTGDFLTCSVALRSMKSYHILSQKSLNLKYVDVKVISRFPFDYYWICYLLQKLDVY